MGKRTTCKFKQQPEMEVEIHLDSSLRFDEILLMFIGIWRFHKVPMMNTMNQKSDLVSVDSYCDMCYASVFSVPDQ